MRVCKDTFIKELAEESGISQLAASKILNNTLELISTHLKNDDSILFTGFGQFQTIDVKPRKGRNIKTGEVIVIPAKKKIKFQPNETLSKAIH